MCVFLYFYVSVCRNCNTALNIQSNKIIPKIIPDPIYFLTVYVCTVSVCERKKYLYSRTGPSVKRVCVPVCIFVHTRSHPSGLGEVVDGVIWCDF